MRNHDKVSLENKKSIYFNEHAPVIYSQLHILALNMNGSQMTVMANVQIGQVCDMTAEKNDMITLSKTVILHQKGKRGL